MTAPTIADTLSELPPTVKAIRASEATGLRKLVYRLGGQPDGQCFGSMMIIADWMWLGGSLRNWQFWETARHELRHHYQSRGWRLPFFVLGYLLLPLPIGFSFRALFELSGYRETLRCRGVRYRATYESATCQQLLVEDAREIAKKFRSRRYGFMGWFFTEAWWKRRLLVMP